MTVSIVLYLDSRSPLQLRHLIQSLQNQTLGADAIEVLLWHTSGTELPQLPEAWKVQTAESVAEAWKSGLAQASGELIAFFQTSALLHREHLRICADALTDQALDAVCVQPDFVDEELMPLSMARLPDMQPADWPGFCLGSRLQWPLESFVFRRSAIEAEAFDALGAQPSALDLLNWLMAHSHRILPVPSLQLPIARFWTKEITESQQQQIQQLLQTYSLGELTPSWALPEGGDKQDYLCYQYICQALRNQGLWQYLEALQQKQLKLTHGIHSIMWLVHETLEPWLPLLQELRSQGVYPTVVVATERPGLLEQPYQLQYDQYQGLATITVSGIPEGEQMESKLTGAPGIVPLVMELFHVLRPERIHLTSLKLFSMYLPTALEHTNTPIYYSLSDDSLLEYRWMLREPEAITENAVNVREWLDHRNRQAEKFLRQLAAAILVHEVEGEAKLQEAGFTPDSYQRIGDGKQLAELYAGLPVIRRRQQYRPSLPMLFETRTGQSMTELLRQDAGRLIEKGRILAYGTVVEPFVQAVIEAKGWAEGALNHATQVEAAREQVMPVHLASVDQISKQIQVYDVLYTPYLLESLRANEVRRMLSSVMLNLRKQGTWALRLLNPRLLKTDAFWLSEENLRPYPVVLIKQILNHIGFEVEEPEVAEEGWNDIYLEARLKSNALPLLNLPPATEALESYWDDHPPAVSLNETDKVLLLGPHIYKAWMMYRVQCDDMLAVTTSYADLLKRQKRSQKFRFRHSNDPVRTLSLFKQTFDVIILQAQAETMSPPELEALLRLCRERLNEGGRLCLQTLQHDPSQPNALFWQSLDHVRPYPELESMLQAQGFKLVARETVDQHLVYQCERAETVAPEPVTPSFPAAVKAIMQQAASVFALESVEDLSRLAPQSQACILAQHLFEQLAPQELPAALRQIVAALKPDGVFVLTFAPAQDWKWQNPLDFRPYSEALIDKLLQDAGLQKRSLTHHNHRWVWCGFRRQSIQPPVQTAHRLRWEGDVLNYHSLATVNRELVKQLLHEPNYEVEVRHFSNPAFVPMPDSPDFPLLQHAYKPLLDAPHVTVRHHWPPDFSLPQTPGHWVMIQPWEFGALPERWIYNMNKFVDQVWVPSEYVRQSYLRSGLLPEKVAVVANGVDPDVYSPEAPALMLPTSKRFKFLFVGGGILRKGVDLLLNAFVETFRGNEDVCLVIKEFGAGKVYRTIEIGEWIERYRSGHPDMPEIVHLNEDLSPEEMPALYNSCDCLVHPFRGEGFALPIAEAMACERSVLVTSYGPTLEYCNDSNAYLIPAQEVPFKEKQIDDTLVTVDYPYWAEPDYESLKALLRHIYENQNEARQKGRVARQTIRENLTWKHSLMQLETQLQQLQERPVYRFFREQMLAELLGEAFANVENQQYEQAITKFQQVLQVDPYQPSVSYNLGVAYLMQADYEHALEHLTQSLREGQVTADLCYAMGTVLRHLGDHPTSQNFFTKARELDPELFAV